MPTNTPTFDLSGTIYEDSNNNGVKDSNETGVKDVVVSTGLNTATTNDSGTFAFNIPTDTYTVSITVPSGYTLTTSNDVQVSLSANSTVNFGIKKNVVVVPTNTPVPQNNNTGGSGGSSSGGSSGSNSSGSGSSGKQGDINNDGKVNIFDLSTLLANFNKTGVSFDLNKDGKVNIFDLSLLLSNWGK